METIATDILTLSAIVAAVVGVLKASGLPGKYSQLVAIGISAVIVLLPESIQQIALQIAVIGLTATGAYEYVKNKPPQM